MTDYSQMVYPPSIRGLLRKEASRTEGLNGNLQRDIDQVWHTNVTNAQRGQSVVVIVDDFAVRLGATVLQRAQMCCWSLARI